MAYADLQNGARCDLRPGDLVFDWTRPLEGCDIVAGHVAISESSMNACRRSHPIRATGLPGGPEENMGGSAAWGDGTSGWTLDGVGQVLGATPEERAFLARRLQRVLRVAEVLLYEVPSVLGMDACQWQPCMPKVLNETVRIHGLAIFVAGTCAGFADYCYECAGIDLVEGSDDRICPPLLAHVLWRGARRFVVDRVDMTVWRFPDCLSGRPDPCGPATAEASPDA